MNAKEEKELIDFGLRQGLHSILNWLAVILIGLACGLVFWQSLLFYFFYCVLRIYAGGYHSETRAGCYLCSIAGIGIYFIILTRLELYKIPCCLAMIISILVILWLAPMDNPNKRLNEAEKNCFRKKTLSILGFETAVFSIAIMLSIPWLYGLIMSAVSFVAVMLAAGLAKREK